MAPWTRARSPRGGASSRARRCTGRRTGRSRTRRARPRAPARYARRWRPPSARSSRAAGAPRRGQSRGGVPSAGPAEKLDGAERHEPGRQQGPDAGRVARRYRGDDKLAGWNDTQGVGDQPRSAALPAPARFQLETQLGEPGDATADDREIRPVRAGVTQHPEVLPDPGPELRPRVGGEVGPVD